MKGFSCRDKGEADPLSRAEHGFNTETLCCRHVLIERVPALGAIDEQRLRRRYALLLGHSASVRKRLCCLSPSDAAWLSQTHSVRVRDPDFSPQNCPPVHPIRCQPLNSSSYKLPG